MNETRPSTPAEEDCCGNACNPCIFDVHKKLLEQWEKSKDQNTIYEKNLLDQLRYQPFTVSSVHETSQDCILFELEYKGNTSDGSRIFFNPGQHVVLSKKIMSRPFTPISRPSEKKLLFLGKIYSKGEFSRYLESLKIGDEFDVRGPYGDFRYKRNSFKKIFMFSIGSGIAAIYPIAKGIVEDDLEETRVQLVAGFHSFDHIPLKKELRELSDYWNFECLLYLSNFDDVKQLTGIKLEKGRFNEENICEILPVNDEFNLILVCGTPEFNGSMVQWIRKLKHKNIHVFE